MHDDSLKAVEYGIGMGMVTGISEATNPVVELTLKKAQFITGAALMLVNSVFVLSIGLLLLPMLQRFNRAIAWSYLATRVIEAMALAVGVMSLLPLSHRAALSCGVGFCWLCSLFRGSGARNGRFAI